MKAVPALYDSKHPPMHSIRVKARVFYVLLIRFGSKVEAR